MIATKRALVLLLWGVVCVSSFQPSPTSFRQVPVTPPVTTTGSTGKLLQEGGRFFSDAPSSALFFHSVENKEVPVGTDIRKKKTRLATASLDLPSAAGTSVLPRVVLEVLSAPPAPTRVVVVEPKTAPKTRDATATKEQAASLPITKMDACLFATYFCNIAVVTLSVVTLPALAAEHFAHSPQAVAAFVAGVASIAPLGGGFGKVVNGFVCQRLGGRKSSWMYLLGLSSLSFGLSMTKSTALVGLIMFGYDFLASIQWTSVCAVVADHFQNQPEQKARGVAILGISSTLGALFAKTVGSALLEASNNNWRLVCQFGGVLGLMGVLAMVAGVKENSNHIDRSNNVVASTSAAAAVGKEATGGEGLSAAAKNILTNPLFWQIGLANSLGFMARNSDRLLGPFLADVASLPGSVCAGLTSSVTFGFLYGLVKGKRFGNLKTIPEKIQTLKGNYRLSVLCMLGLAACGMNSTMLMASKCKTLIAGLITVLSGLMASTVAMQFYNFPNLMSGAIFPDSSSISLSLTDAVGFFATAQMFALNSWIVARFGWSASWMFLATIFSIGGGVMMNAIPTILRKVEQDKQQQLAM